MKRIWRIRYFCRRSTTRSRSWTHLMKTATKIPHWSCSCCATTSLCGPVTRRATGTSHRRAATTNLPKLKSFLNLIRTSYSLSSPRPPEVLTHMSINPDPSIHVHLTSRPSRTSFPSFLPSFQSQASLFLKSLSFSKETDPLLPPSLSLSLFFSFSLSLSWHDRTLLPMPPPQLLRPVRKIRTLRASELFIHTRSCLFADDGKRMIFKIKLNHGIVTSVDIRSRQAAKTWSVYRVKITRKKTIIGQEGRSSSAWIVRSLAHEIS